MAFKTDKQRKAVMAKLTSGNRSNITPQIIGKFPQKAINKDISSYKNFYARGALNYLLDDYGRKGLIKGYERLHGSDQQRIEINGKIIYDSLKTPKISEKKFREILSKSLNTKILKKNIETDEYIVSFRYTGEKPDASIHNVRYSNRSKALKDIKTIDKTGKLFGEDVDKLSVKVVHNFTDKRTLDNKTKVIR